MKELIILLFICLSPVIFRYSPEMNLYAADQEMKYVFFIIIDALRADHLGIYGYPRNTSPNLDRLARKGIVFDRAIVQAGWTKSSIGSYISSTYPSIHKIIRGPDQVPENLTTMAEIFRANGYFTYGFHNNVQVDAPFKFDRGYRIYKYLSDNGILRELWFALTKGFIDPAQFDREYNQSFVRFLNTGDSANIIDNHGFEEKFAGWTGETDWLTGEEAHSGSFTAHIDRQTFPAKFFSHLKKTVTLKHGTDYLFGAFVKTKNLEGEAAVEIYEFDNKKQTRTFSISGDNDWTLLVGIFRPPKNKEDRKYYPPKYETAYEIRATQVKDFQGGEFWVDDIFIIPLAEAPPGTLLKPAEKIFFYLHFIDPHNPYFPPEEYLEYFTEGKSPTLIDRYDGEIRSIDAKLGLLFELLESKGILDESMVIITSDHGEAFGEHGKWRHGPWGHNDEVARVPLIIYSPKLFPSPKRVDETIQASVDLLPSLVEILKLKVPPGVKFQGHSYLPEVGSPSPFAFFYNGPHVDMVTDKRWKYISNEYYNSVEGVDIKAFGLGEAGVRITISSSTAEGNQVFLSENDLINSGFYKSLSPAVQEEVLALYGKANGTQALLYDLESDPGEVNNVIDKYPDRATEFKQIIQERIQSDRDYRKKSNLITGGKAKINNKMKEQLRALGYIN